jgi:hypothetical protein
MNRVRRIHGWLLAAVVGSGAALGAIASPSLAWPRPTRHVQEVLQGDRIGSVHFGATARIAVPRLDALLGHGPTQRYHLSRACGVDRAIAWPGLVVVFHREHLVGYSYRPAYGDHRIPTLATARGLLVGDTLQLARRLYGRAFHNSPQGGGRWWAATRDGLVQGLTSGWPNGPRGSVATIAAGHLGCPGSTL